MGPEQQSGSSSLHARSSPAPDGRHLTSSVRRPSRRRLDTRAVAFALSLCVPYVSAKPLPCPPAVTPTTMHPISRLSVLASSLGGSALRLLPRSKMLPTADVSYANSPQFSWASLNRLTGLYDVPDSMVILRQQFNPGFIVLSYAIAFVGSICTLELLIRRTSNSGWRNQLLLLSAGATFGSVSTFSMHFIFNNSLSLHHPLQHINDSPSLYLSYDAGFTILSLVASCTAMTIAFFIMGTTWDDWWYFVPGREQKRRRTRRRGGDEYRNWKETQSKKALRRGTVGMGVLMGRAGDVAKWSMMGDMNKGEKEWDTDDGADEDDIIKQDKKLSELDFRFGRNAAKIELEKRQEARIGTSTTTSSQLNMLDGGSTVRLMSSNASTLTTPSPAYFASPLRRGSLPPDQSTHAPKAVFTPDYNFPTRSDAETPSTSLLHPSAPWSPATASSASPLTPNTTSSPIPFPPLIPSSTCAWPIPTARGSTAIPPDINLNSFPDQSKRRASLPVSSLARPDQAWRSGPTLTRIQSLSEQDLESGVTPDTEKNFPVSPTLAVSARLGNVEQDHHSGSRSPSPTDKQKRQTRFVGAGKTLNRLETFLGFDVVTKVDIVKIVLTGTIAGFGVAAMHYIGQLSITGMPYIAYKAPYVVASVIIASGAVCVALYIMFIMLRPKLKHNWWSKTGVALILSVAVCAMHFCGMMGTIYAWPRGQGVSPHSILTGGNRAITGIVASLAFVACLACGCFFILHSLRQRRERARRRRVVVAAICLDQNDRVLVNSIDGTLPMCDIANLTGAGPGAWGKRSSKSSASTFSSDSTVLGMDLTTGHDAFVSALKMSWSWRIPGIAGSGQLTASSESSPATLSGTLADVRRGSLLTVDSSITGSRVVKLSVSKFLERFAVSAGQLATQLTGQKDGISRLGVLYDQILTTGWVKLNNSNDTVSKGQLIFLVRRITSATEKSDLLSKNYIFADSQAVASTVHKTLSVPLEHTLPLLADMRRFCNSTLKISLKPGSLYAGVAVVQATPFDGLRILLEQANRSQLPMREICTFGNAVSSSDELSGTIEEIGEAITWLEGMSLLSVITRNMTIDSEQLGGPRVTRLLSALERALIPMLDDLLSAEDMAHILPRLTLHPVLVPLTPGWPHSTNAVGYTPPYLVVFYANYDAAVNTFTDKWLPFSLYSVQNACVMAQRVQAAQKAETTFNAPLPAGPAAPNGLAPGYNYSRRPSKVQFEVPLPPTSETSVSHFPPLASSEPPANLFSGFFFPPGPDEQSQRYPTSTSILHAPPAKSAVPRRSSLARSRFGSVSEMPTTPVESKEFTFGTASDEAVLPAGVGSWDPDWLLVLLRTKLRAET